MLQIEIPGRETLELRHLVLDYNGTIAVDGQILEALRERLRTLSHLLEIHVLTADTYGTVARQCDGLPLTVRTFPRAEAGVCKAEIVRGLEGGVVCLGNGYNAVSYTHLDVYKRQPSYSPGFREISA